MLQRYLIGFVAAIAIWVAILHFTYMPRDRFLPPGLSFGNLSEKTTGYVVNAAESTYGDHWMNGNLATEWYMEYKFQPTIWVNIGAGDPEKRPLTTWQTGRIPIPEATYKAVTPGRAITVTYDPWNPLINGVTGTGLINLDANWHSGWLLFPLGFIATMILIAEVMKKWIVPSGI